MNLSIRIFDPSEQEYLSKILELSGRRLKLFVQKTDMSAADVVFVKQDEPGASILINSCANRDRPIVVVYGGEKGYFKWTLEKPATSKDVMNLLTSLEGRLGHDQPPANEAGDCPQRGLFPVAQGGSLIDRLHEIMAGAEPYAILANCRHEIILDVASNRAFVTPSLFENKVKLIETALQTDHEALVKVDGKELSQLTDGMAYISTEYFVWLIAQEAQPLLNTSPATLDQRFQLTRWPSFTTLHHKSYHIAITGRLMKKSMSINELLTVSDAPLAELAKFYNFAYACNLLGTSQATRAAAAAQPIGREEHDSAQAEKLGILGKILRRLAG